MKEGEQTESLAMESTLSSSEIFTLKSILQIELIGVNPKLLSFRDRLKQRRQVENLPNVVGTDILQLPLSPEQENEILSSLYGAEYENTRPNTQKESLHQSQKAKEKVVFAANPTDDSPNETKSNSKKATKKKTVKRVVHKNNNAEAVYEEMDPILQEKLRNLSEVYRNNEIDFVTFFDNVRSLMPSLLNEEQMSVITFFDLGKTKANVRVEMDYSIEQLNSQLYAIRKQVMTKLFSPLEIIPIPSKLDPALKTAAYSFRKKRVTSGFPNAQFLGYSYTTETEIASYQKKRKTKAESPKEPGLVRLIDAVDPVKYNTIRLKNSYRQFIITDTAGSLFIHPDNLTQILKSIESNSSHFKKLRT